MVVAVSQLLGSPGCVFSARHNWLVKVSESANQIFLDLLPKALILAGFGDLKNELLKSGLLDQRLQKLVVSTIDIAYGGSNGFDEAIKKSSDLLSDCEFTAHQKAIQEFFEEIAKDEGLYFFGEEQTREMLEQGAVKVLIIHEDFSGGIVRGIAEATTES